MRGRGEDDKCGKKGRGSKSDFRITLCTKTIQATGNSSGLMHVVSDGCGASRLVLGVEVGVGWAVKSSCGGRGS